MLYEVENIQAAPGLGLAAAWSPSAEDPAARPAMSSPLALQLAAKRGIDVVLSLLLLVLFSPLLVGVAVAIRLIDGSRVFYTQERYGRLSRPFRIVKFRTMRVAESGRRFVQVARNDPRVTPLGAFLRRTSIDELPQLLNVLVGDMSLIGPRPHAIAMEEQNFMIYPRAAGRLAMRPGMTGLAQIRGQRGPTSARAQLRARIDSDLEYVQGWTLGRDLMVMLKTPAAWFFGKNAH